MNTNELHVIFGTGPLGKGVARELVKRGVRVRMVNRSGKVIDVPREVEIVKGDAYNSQITRELTLGAAAVYQCAQPAYHEWAEKFPPLQAAIMEGAIANGAKFIVGDNLYSYGDPKGEPITENSLIAPNTKKGRVRAQMAETVMEAHHSGKVRVAIGRASNFFGPEYDLLTDMFFAPALAGKSVSVLGNPDVPHTFTYIPDFGKGLAILGTDNRSLGQVWIVPSQPAITQRKLTEMVYREAGFTEIPKIKGLSRMMVRIGGIFNSSARETVEMMYEWEKPYIVESTKFEQTFGIKPTPLEEAVHVTVGWYQAHLQREREQLS
jgi:nucleoside-diphosphate-sugar epimerase